MTLIALYPALKKMSETNATNSALVSLTAWTPSVPEPAARAESSRGPRHSSTLDEGRLSALTRRGLREGANRLVGAFTAPPYRPGARSRQAGQALELRELFGEFGINIDDLIQIAAPGVSGQAWERMPAELWRQIASHADDQALLSLSLTSKTLYRMLNGPETGYLLQRASKRANTFEAAKKIVAALDEIDSSSVRSVILTTLIRSGANRPEPTIERTADSEAQRRAALSYPQAKLSEYAKRLKGPLSWALLGASGGLGYLASARLADRARLATQPDSEDLQHRVGSLNIGTALAATTVASIGMVQLWNLVQAHKYVRGLRQVEERLSWPKLPSRDELRDGRAFRQAADAQKFLMAVAVAVTLRKIEVVQHRAAPMGALCQLGLPSLMKNALVDLWILPQLKTIPAQACVREVLPHLLRCPGLSPNVVLDALEVLKATLKTCGEERAYAEACGALALHVPRMPKEDRLAPMQDLLAEEGPLSEIPAQYLSLALVPVATVVFSGGPAIAQDDELKVLRQRFMDLQSRITERTVPRRLLPESIDAVTTLGDVGNRLFAAIAERTRYSSSDLKDMVHLAGILYSSVDAIMARFLEIAASRISAGEQRLDLARDVVHALQRIQTENNDKILTPLMGLLLAPSAGGVHESELEALIDLLAAEVASPETYNARSLSLAMEGCLEARLQPCATLRPGTPSYDRAIRIAEKLEMLANHCPYRIESEFLAQADPNAVTKVPLTSEWSNFLEADRKRRRQNI